MQAQNHKEINQSYFKFSAYLVGCVFIGVMICFCYLQTSNTEVERIVEKTEEYDKIYLRQIELVARIDSLHTNTTRFNTNLNDAHLLNAVSKQKQEIQMAMEELSSRDIRLYQKLISEMNVFLQIKDSIRIAKIEEELIKTDLLKCTEDNKRAARKLTLGSFSLNQ